MSKVRLGSALDTIDLAVISSPVERTTLVAEPSFTRTSITSASQRISAPAFRADDAMDCVTAPIPPNAKVDEPAGCTSPAARMRRTKLLPADHGPRNVP